MHACCADSIHKAGGFLQTQLPTSKHPSSRSLPLADTMNVLFRNLPFGPFVSVVLSTGLSVLFAKLSIVPFHQSLSGIPLLFIITGIAVSEALFAKYSPRPFSQSPWRHLPSSLNVRVKPVKDVLSAKLFHRRLLFTVRVRSVSKALFAKLSL